MRYLLDTHVLLWWRADDSRLPHRWDPIFGNTEDHDITFSIVSLWEIAIKRALGTLELAVPMAEKALRPLLRPALSIAAVNAPAMCVVAGETLEVDALEAELRASGLEPVRLRGGAPPPPPSSTFPPVSAFDEASAAAGNLGRFPGRELMPLLARMAGAWGGDCGVE